MNRKSLLCISLVLALFALSSVQLAEAQTEAARASMMGKWTDNYGYKWLLFAFGGKIFGYVDTISYGKWIVEGSYDAAAQSFEMTAHNPPPIEDGSVEWFTYTGTYTATTASGTWVNSADLSGSFSMTKGWPA